jgi:hypothetical protein
MMISELLRRLVVRWLSGRAPAHAPRRRVQWMCHGKSRSSESEMKSVQQTNNRISFIGSRHRFRLWPKRAFFLQAATKSRSPTAVMSAGMHLRTE